MLQAGLDVATLHHCVCAEIQDYIYAEVKARLNNWACINSVSLVSSRVSATSCV